MGLERAIRWFAIVAMMGGVLRICSSIAPYFIPKLELEYLYTATELSLMMGLIGIFLGQANRINTVGFCGASLAILAFGLIAGPDAYLQGVNTYVVGGPLIGVGLLLYSAAQLQGRVVHISAPLLVIFSMVAGAGYLAAPDFKLLTIMQGMTLGLAFIINGWSVFHQLSRSAGPVAEPLYQ